MIKFRIVFSQRPTYLTASALLRPDGPGLLIFFQSHEIATKAKKSTNYNIVASPVCFGLNPAAKKN
jgi:hypothetical protein